MKFIFCISGHNKMATNSRATTFTIDIPSTPPSETGHMVGSTALPRVTDIIANAKLQNQPIDYMALERAYIRDYGACYVSVEGNVFKMSNKPEVVERNYSPPVCNNQPEQPPTHMWHLGMKIPIPANSVADSTEKPSVSKSSGSTVSRRGMQTKSAAGKASTKLTNAEITVNDTLANATDSKAITRTAGAKTTSTGVTTRSAAARVTSTGVTTRSATSKSTSTSATRGVTTRSIGAKSTSTSAATGVTTRSATAKVTSTGVTTRSATAKVTSTGVTTRSATAKASATTGVAAKNTTASESRVIVKNTQSSDKKITGTTLSTADRKYIFGGGETKTSNAPSFSDKTTLFGIYDFWGNFSIHDDPNYLASRYDMY